MIPGVRFGIAEAAVVALVLARAVVLAATPLSFDEAYYWLWSKHLAAGYLDHPPMIAFLIRAGTGIFGDTSWGVRAACWALSAAATWAVWRSGAKAGGDRRTGAAAALLFNLMPMIAIETGVATPDAPQIAAASFMLLFLAKLAETGFAPWWIAVGVAAGFALLSKYTAVFLGAGIILWLIATAKQRHWLWSPWPYAGAAVALAMFAPVVLWNAEHNWISFAMQFGRTSAGAFTLRFLGEFLGGQLLLASPVIAVLGVAGAVTAFRPGAPAALRMAVWLIIPGAVYFLVHSLHDRVQGNWPSFIYPALAVAAAVSLTGRVRSSRWLTFWRGAAVPVAALLVAAIYGQALFGLVQMRDPVSRLLGYGMKPVTTNIEQLYTREHATAVVTTNYALNGWLSWYLREKAPVIQLNERSRYLNEPAPDLRLLRGPVIYVSQVRNQQTAELAHRFAQITPLENLLRTRNRAVIDQYAVFRLDGPKGAVLSDDKVTAERP